MSQTDRKPSRDGAHRVATMLAGWHTPRAWWRRLTAAKFRRACVYVWACIAAANDNDVPAAELVRPKWFPKRYVYGGKR